MNKSCLNHLERLKHIMKDVGNWVQIMTKIHQDEAAIYVMIDDK